MIVDDPILIRFRGAIKALYGDTIERIVLFGSRARGDAKPGSDYDIAVFLKEMEQFGIESERLAEIETDILLNTGAVINTLPFREGDWKKRTGFMHEVRSEGLDL